MFGYSIFEIYFMINLIYTVITFFFLHNIIVEKVYKEYKNTTSKTLTNQEIQVSMNIFYVMSAFIGSFRLFKDVMSLLFNHRECIWLYQIYKKDE